LKADKFTYLFYDGTDGTNKGFKKAGGLFEYVYKATKAKSAITSATKASDLTLTTDTHDDGKKVEHNDATVGLTKVPVVTVAAAGKAGIAFTCTVTMTPGKSTDFYTNGKLYSAAALTLSQASANAAFGITFRYLKDTKPATSNMKISPTIKAGTLAIARVDGLATDAYSFTTNSGMALTSGTVSASNSTVQAFKVGTNGDFGINVTHSAKLKTAITTTAIQVQQVTCLDVYIAKDPKQYLCVLTDVATVSPNKEATTYKVTHEVWSMDTDVLTTNVPKADKALNDATNLGEAKNKSALMYRAISNDATVGTEATLKGMDIPSTKMNWPGGNYLSMDLLNMQAKVGYIGAANANAKSAGDNKTMIDAIKTGLAKAFTGTAAKDNTTWVAKVGAETELKTKTAASCDNPTEATCISKHPTKCKASGALSTVATVGAAIAALAMSF